MDAKPADSEPEQQKLKDASQWVQWSEDIRVSLGASKGNLIGYVEPLFDANGQQNPTALVAGDGEDAAARSESIRYDNKAKLKILSKVDTTARYIIRGLGTAREIYEALQEHFGTIDDRGLVNNQTERSRISHTNTDDANDTMRIFMEKIHEGRRLGDATLTDRNVAVALTSTMQRASDWNEFAGRIADAIAGYPNNQRVKHTMAAFRAEQTRRNIRTTDNAQAGAGAGGAGGGTRAGAVQDESLLEDRLMAKFEERLLKLMEANGRGKGQRNRSSLICYNCGKKGHFASDCRGNCGSCNKPGHKKKDCPDANKTSAALVSDNTNNKHYSRVDTTISTPSNESNKPECTCVAQSTDPEWHVDSGCARHAGSARSGLTCEKAVNHPGVVTADGSTHKVDTTGDIDIVTLNGDKLHLKDVRKVNGLDLNLMSVADLNDDGKSVLFKPYKDANNKSKAKVEVHVDKTGELVASADRNEKTRLYTFKNTGNRFALLMNVDAQEQTMSFNERDAWDEHVDKSSAKQKTVKVNVKEWHAKTGHGGKKKTLAIIYNAHRGMNVQLIGEANFKNCETCKYAKQHRKAVTKKMRHVRASKVCHRTYSDLAGPMIDKGDSGPRYRFSAIDDHDDYSTVEFLRKKSETYEKIKDYVAWAEKQFEEPCKIWHSDRGGEYTSDKLVRYYKERGMVQELTEANTPHQNGRAERFNRVIDEKSSALMMDANLQPKKYWHHADRYANMVRNYTPSDIDGLSPHERRYKTPPRWEDLKPFGYPGYMHIPKAAREKYGSKSMKIIYLGPAPNSRGDLVVDPTTGRCYTSRDVEVDSTLENGYGQGRLAKSATGGNVVGDPKFNNVHVEELQHAQHVDDTTAEDLRFDVVTVEDWDDDEDEDDEMTEIHHKTPERPTVAYPIDKNDPNVLQIPEIDMSRVHVEWRPSPQAESAQPTAATPTQTTQTAARGPDTKSAGSGDKLPRSEPSEPGPRRSTRVRAAPKRLTYDSNGATSNWTPKPYSSDGEGAVNETETTKEDVAEHVNLVYKKGVRPQETVWILSGTGEEWFEYEPVTHQDILRITSEDGKREWLESERNEYTQLEANNTFEWTRLPYGRKAIGSKFVYKLKRDAEQNPTKRKSRFIAHGPRVFANSRIRLRRDHSTGAVVVIVAVSAWVRSDEKLGSGRHRCEQRVHRKRANDEQTTNLYQTTADGLG